ncbi:hypothetical protein CEN49_24645 [Fischerella thermalis CCMEE 5273]|nr:hypothetical protein CBP17_15830 [Fischerella thermalis WC114]PLZ09505.1 hypothetical protein CBP19_15570 [Fischerella thermalis WC1110]PLZ10142.1 hypothetical protein CBP18_11415 [Fischerella thermalis WC119]PLZ17163.1 hypothetical protein CBP29_21415 [Fischerella thermalis WC341]PLZ45331.1 hypothetical protein CBP26_01865 [Fischerella thermalis WC538]PLZ76880.1 hypothetical protein CBP20_21025 [Fischerella thermalis WC213]PMB02835.1 hypothetical protein CEN49_24645 [Fischerella thermalis
MCGEKSLPSRKTRTKLRLDSGNDTNSARVLPATATEYIAVLPQTATLRKAAWRLVRLVSCKLLL